MVKDRPTRFVCGGQIYEPRNYKEEYHGEVTMRYALALSLNNATVKLAEEVGYDKVADLARSAGMTSGETPPGGGRGALRAPPLARTAAHNRFAKRGRGRSPGLLHSVRNREGEHV